MATTRSSASGRHSPRTPARNRRPATHDASIFDKIPTKYHAAIYIGLILLTLLIFFQAVLFGGETFAANDSISWLSFQPYLDMVSAAGEHPFWIPYIFSGMPAYGAYLVTGNRWWDLSMMALGWGERIFGVLGYYWTSRVILHYFIYGLGMYLLMRSKKSARSTATLVAIAAMFSTWVIIYVMIGHNTKIMVLMTFPFIFMCLERLIHRWSFLYAGLLLLAVHIMMEANHPQTAFYGACAVGIYLLFELIGYLMAKQKDMALGAVRAGLVAIVAAGFAYGMGIDRYQAIAEYTPYSTRGAPALRQDTLRADRETADGGHGYKYATDWSFSPEEVVTYVVPGYFGFGKMEVGEGANKQMASTYWGQMPFTDAAHYMGIGILILGLFGAWMNRSNRFVQGLIVIGLFGLFLSFGRNGLSFLYDFFYYNVPSFNRLRAPSQSLVLLEFVFPILAGFGLETAIAMRKGAENVKAEKSILYSAFGFGGAMLLGLLYVTTTKSSYMQAIASVKNRADYGHDLTPVSQYIYSTMQSDWVMSMLFGTATLVLLYMFVSRRIQPWVFKAAIFILVIWDLWRIDMRPMETVPLNDALAVFQENDIDAFLKSDTTAYRILDVTLQQPNYAAHKLQEHILGYHAAKMRSYQNLLDFTGRSGSVPETPLVWNMLNTKYIIAGGLVDPSLKPVFQSQQKRNAVVTLNPDAMPRAWFVNRVEVASDTAVLMMLGDTTYRAQPGHRAFDLRDVAWLSEKLSVPIDPVGYIPASGESSNSDTTRPDTTGNDTTAGQADIAQPGAATPGNGSVTFTRRTPHHIEMDVNAPGPTNNFLVISEIDYPPGWRATIDGKDAEIIKTNYLLRGMVIPAGQHKVEMHYYREGFATHKIISLVLNVIMLGIIGYGAWIYRRRPAERDPIHDAPKISPVDV